MARNPRPTLAVVTEFRALSRLHFAEISERYKEYSRLLDSELNVRVFAIAYGADADLNTLTRISQASRGAVYDASDPTTISKVFVSVISNF